MMELFHNCFFMLFINKDHKGSALKSHLQFKIPHRAFSFLQPLENSRWRNRKKHPNRSTTTELWPKKGKCYVVSE